MAMTYCRVMAIPDLRQLQQQMFHPFRKPCLRANFSRTPQTRVSPVRAEDPGDWRYSPEWWGTQGRGWGRNEGVTVFQDVSASGNGVITVTAHPASSTCFKAWPELSKVLLEKKASVACEWRVLRFNNETRQSVAKVLVVQESNAEEPFLMQIPQCLAFEYLKSVASVGLAAVNCAGLDLKLVAEGEKQIRCLCVGLGGGSLPLFLANNMQGCSVDVVEIDNKVISAATGFMGFPTYELRQHSGQSSVAHVTEYVNTSLPPKSSRKSVLWGNLVDRIRVFEADAAAFLCTLLENISPEMGSHYDLVFIDAFNGNDEVPLSLWSSTEPFLDALSDLLNPHRGTVVVNLHTDMLPPTLFERISGQFGPGYDVSLPGGKLIREIASAYRNKLLQFSRQKNPMTLNFQDNHGVAFTVAVPRQQNICLVVSRGISGTKMSVLNNLEAAATNLQQLLKIPFPMVKQVSRGFAFV